MQNKVPVLAYNGKTPTLSDLRGVTIHIATGSNLGQREAHLAEGERRLLELGDILRISPLYLTAAVGMAPGTPDFLNRVVELKLHPKWQDEPLTVMQALLDIENELGRARSDESAGYVSRTLDLDIVLWGDQTLDLPQLQVPHPRMLKRRFVMQPLADLVPHHTIPGTGRSVQECLDALPDDVPQIAPWPQPNRSPIAISSSKEA
jgi:2-amino-4-hydroxy-6-hydroxymethyldihydropteridine diphosphokinase